MCDFLRALVCSFRAMLFCLFYGLHSHMITVAATSPPPALASTLRGTRCLARRHERHPGRCSGGGSDLARKRLGNSACKRELWRPQQTNRPYPRSCALSTGGCDASAAQLLLQFVHKIGAGQAMDLKHKKSKKAQSPFCHLPSEWLRDPATSSCFASNWKGVGSVPSTEAAPTCCLNFVECVCAKVIWNNRT